MSRSDSYLTIRARAETELKIKGSRFIGQAERCRSEVEAEAILAGVRKRFYDASHHCYAYQAGLGEQKRFRYSDAGEPSGTAGKPIYDQIAGKGLTNLIVIVTRYFGGTKLGTGGLTHAYSQAASLTIAEAGIVEEFLTEEILIKFSYHDYNTIERLIYKYEGKVQERGINEINPYFRISLRLSLIEKFCEDATEATSGRVKFGETA